MRDVELTIGEFSRLTGLTVKTLRFYHENQLLEPSRVDAGSGYRYYSIEKVELARAISVLRELGFPIKEIAELLRTDSRQGQSLVEFLERRREQLEASIRDDRARLHRLDEMIAFERQAEHRMETSPSDVFETEIPTQWIASLLHQGRYSDSGKLFGKLARQYGRYLSGKAMMLCLDDAYRDGDANFEVAFPVKPDAAKKGGRVRELLGGKALCVTHVGPYSDLTRSYTRLIGAAREREWDYRLPTREVYRKGPGMIFRGNENKYITEIQLLASEAGR